MKCRDYFLSILPFFVSGQDSLQSKYELNLDELFKVNVSVASKTMVSEFESPGIVTIIDREEILNSGARDFIDVLRLVPGVSFGY